MNLDTQFKQVESIEFAAYFLVAGNIRIFQIALDTSETSRSFITNLNERPSQRSLVADRLLELLQAEANPENLLVHDIAIAAYLYFLHATGYSTTSTLAIKVSERLNLWWAHRMSKYILEASATTTAIQDSIGDTEAFIYLSSQAAEQFVEFQLPFSLFSEKKSLIATNGSVDLKVEYGERPASVSTKQRLSA